MLDELQREMHELLLGLLGLTKKLADNQEKIAKNHEQLRVRVGSLEEWCELLDERITAACSMLNLE